MAADLDGVAKRVRGRVNQWIDEYKQDALNVVDMVEHRITKGSPPLFDVSDDVLVSPRASLDVKQERIKRRRQLLGLEYEPWTGVGGK